MPTTVAAQSSFQEVMMLGRICWLRWCHGESYAQIHNFQVRILHHTFQAEFDCRPCSSMCLVSQHTYSTFHAMIGVNARVSDVSDWIDAVVCELSDNPPAEFCPPPPVVVVVVVPPREWSNDLTGKGVVAGMLLALFLALCILLVIRILRGKEKKDVSTGSPEQESLRKSPSDSYHSVEGVEVM